jgi:hypothetical protein
VSLPTGWPGDFSELTVSWVPATDATSGIAGYSILLSPLSDPLPDDTVDITSETITLPLEAGDWWFKVLAVDNAGNPGPVDQAGLFVVDPALPAFVVPATAQLAVEGEMLQVQWEPVIGAYYGALYVSYDGGQTHEQITSVTAEQLAAGLFPWMVPAEITDEAVLLLRVIEASDDYWAASPVFLIRTVSDVGEGTSEAAATALAANYPNPFNPLTTIAFDLTGLTTVSLRILDVSGRQVRVLLDNVIVAGGRHEVFWDGRNSSGQRVASGSYFYRLEAGDFVETKRMTLLK